MATPVNDTIPAHDPGALGKAVDYAMGIAESYGGRLPDGMRSLRGLSVLEIGPGNNLAAALIMACHGAQMTVVDRFPARWFPEYHGVLYRMLLEKLRSQNGSLDLEPLERCVARESHSVPGLRSLPCPAETLDAVADESMDVSFSNAVFEHLGDVRASLESLARVTKMGGLGFHQVDFRDHRDFSRPLEYLTLREDEFARMFEEGFGECGNRCRPQEMQGVFEACGFEVMEFSPNIFTEDAYLDDVLPRIKGSERSRYSRMGAEELKVLSGRFAVKKARSAHPPRMKWSPDTIRHFWAHFAGTSVQRSRMLGRKQSAFLWRLLKDLLPKGARCLDYGRITQELWIGTLLDQGFRVAGCSWSEPPKGLGHGFAGHPLYLGDLDAGGGDHRFDVVFMIGLLEQLQDEDLHRALDQATNWLVPGGLIVALAKNRENLADRMVYCPLSHHVFHPDQHLRSFDSQALEDLFRRFGVALERLHEIEFSNRSAWLEECHQREIRTEELLVKLDRLAGIAEKLDSGKLGRILKEMAGGMRGPHANGHAPKANLRLGDGSTILFVGRKNHGASKVPSKADR